MSNQKVILLVEDDLYTSDLYKKYLSNANYHVICVADGIKALAQAKAHNIDLIMLDIMLPRMDGFEFLNRLKKEVPDKEIPVIILSNLDRDSIIKEGFDLGAIGYIVKSNTTPEKVVEEVNKVLSTNI